MNKLDRLVVRAVIGGHVKFGIIRRFAAIGKVQFYKPVVGSGKWAILFGHTDLDHGLDLGFVANVALDVAAKYAPITGMEE